MRFLKGMLARKLQDDEPMAMPQQSAPTAPLTSVADLWDDDEDDLDMDAEPAKPAPQQAAAAPNAREPESNLLTSRPLSQDVVKIWDLFSEDEAEQPAPPSEMAAVAAREPVMAHSDDVPPEPSPNELAREALQAIKARALDPGAGEPTASGQRPPTRTKTRVLGFAAGDAMGADMFAAPQKEPSQGPCFFPVGWIVVIDGPGRGASFPLLSGVSQIGRGDGQAVQLNFGDTAISRENHASIAYDEEQNVFYIGHGGKANIVRLNGKPVLSTEEIANADMIRIGETTLRFVALCGPDFAWDLTDDAESGSA